MFLFYCATKKYENNMWKWGWHTVIVFHRPFENGWDLYISFLLKRFVNVTSGLLES